MALIRTIFIFVLVPFLLAGCGRKPDAYDINQSTRETMLKTQQIETGQEDALEKFERERLERLKEESQTAAFMPSDIRVETFTPLDAVGWQGPEGLPSPIIETPEAPEPVVPAFEEPPEKERS